MTTTEAIHRYFEALTTNGDWRSFLADDMEFTSFTTPVKHVKGKAAYLESTKRFFSMIKSVELRELVSEGTKACAFTRYQIQTPAGGFNSDVAELMKVEGAKIVSLSIYFDTAPFPK